MCRGTCCGPPLMPLLDRILPLNQSCFPCYPISINRPQARCRQLDQMTVGDRENKGSCRRAATPSGLRSKLRAILVALSNTQVVRRKWQTPDEAVRCRHVAEWCHQGERLPGSTNPSQRAARLGPQGYEGAEVLAFAVPFLRPSFRRPPNRERADKTPPIAPDLERTERFLKGD